MAEVLRPAPEPEPPREVTASAAQTPPPAEPVPPRSSPFAAYLNAAAAHPDPAPSPADDGVPESVPSAHAGDVFADAEELMRDAIAQGRAEEPITTSPLVDAIPVPEPEPEPEPEPRTWAPPTPPTPPTPPPAPEPEPVLRAVPEPPPAPPRPAAGPVPRPQAARHLVGVLATRGLDPDLAGSVVDDALLHRLPLEPLATLPGAVAAQLAARIPVAHMAGAAERVLVIAGAAGAGGPRLVAGVAGAYASRTTVEVACIALRTPDGGRALAAALAPIGVPVHTAHDGEQAATHLRNLGQETLVVVDTPPVTPDDAGALAAHLEALGPHELHLALGPGGGPTAPELIAALQPARLALGDPSDPLYLGAVLQAAIDSACPITFVAASDAMGRPDLAVHPADAAALARALTG
jgi:hypothetical protein